MVSSDSPEERERRRRRRAAELLGDLEPRVSRDESPEGWNEDGGTSREDELLRDVPPHHG
jgi:hypothetical protein